MRRGDAVGSAAAAHLRLPLRPAQYGRSPVALLAVGVAHRAHQRGGLRRDPPGRVRAVPRGQSEAAQSVGMRYWQTMRLVVLPQAVRQTTPALVGQLVRLLKDSTLGYVVSFLELLNSAKVLGEYNGTIIQGYLVVALIFIVLNNALAGAAGLLERRMSGSPRRAAAH
ncbi:ABC transporter permease subunit [Streptomyces sp. M19]